MKRRVDMEHSRSREGTSEHFDVLVLGSGEAGKYLSWALGGEGKRVALIERRYVGGSCPNIACLPSKNVIHSAKIAHYARRLGDFGMLAQLAPVDMSVVRSRKRRMVAELVKVHEDRFAASHVEFVCGQGVFTGSRTISVQTQEGDERLLTAETIIVSTGSRTSVPEIPGLVDAAPMTHVEQLELDKVPEHLVILGAGYIGLEFAQAMARFGSRVTVIGRSSRLLPQEDEDVSVMLKELLTAEGVHFVLGAKVRSVEGKSGHSIRATLGPEQATLTIDATHLLVATGRRPNTDGIGLEKTGVELTATEHIKVDASTPMSLSTTTALCSVRFEVENE
jgi:pyruvate/2-oxoglutarate dehydrogenase complex dihydrolipoamide dehydrogenase (E3) component